MTLELSDKAVKEGQGPLPVEPAASFDYRRLNATFLETAVHLGFIAFLAYWSYLLVSPFLPVMVWSAVLTVALYPAFSWLAGLLGGRRRLAATIITGTGLLLVIGPVTWLGLGLVDGLRLLIERLGSGKLVPPPPDSIKDWPLIGPQVFDFWSLASTNVRDAIAHLLPTLQPVGQFLFDLVSSAGAGMFYFLVSLIIAGFLFSPGPLLLVAVKRLALRIDSGHGEEFVELAGATIRAVSRGVIGISLLQAAVGGLAMSLAGVPGASVLTLGILVLGIVQVGSTLIVVPLIIWSWAAMNAGPALAFTALMAVVLIMENFLKPFVLTRGLTTPTLVTLIGVIGGVLTYGIAGLFVGPVVLAVAWDLANAWIHESAAPAPHGAPAGIVPASIRCATGAPEDR